MKTYLLVLMNKQQIFLSLYNLAMKNFGGRGLRKYPLIKNMKNFMISQAKSDFAIVQGHKMYLGPKDSLGLSINGVYEDIETELVKNEIKEGDVVLDVGANIGYYSLIFAKLVGKYGKVFAFEPESYNFGLLNKNLRINGYQNVITKNTVVSDYIGTTKLYLSNLTTGMHRIYPSQYCTSKTINVETLTLDNYLNAELVDKISFVKIDVEGSELGVLRGMKNILQKNNKLKILLEFVPFCLREFGTQPKDLLTFLVDMNFEISYRNDQTNKFESADDDFLLTKFDVTKFDRIPPATNILCIRK